MWIDLLWHAGLQVKTTSSSGLGYLDEHTEAGWALVDNRWEHETTH